MRPMTRLILGTASLAGIAAAVALGLPSHVTVSRSVVINAPESAIFPYLNNLHKFVDWSPFSARDPQLAVSYGGPESGQGARVTWSSKKPSIGTGSMEISETQPSRHIDLVVNYNGLDGTSSYDVVPSGAGSKVVWTFGYESGSNPLKLWKALMLDGFVGAEYRTGLDRLRDKIEADRRPTMPTMVPTPQAGVPGQAGQPAAALPPGAPPPPPGAPLPQGAAPQAGAGTPAATTAPQAGAAPAAQPSPQPAATSSAPKKKKRQQQ